MVSARAAEYIRRFGDVDAIVQYREECKQLHADAAAGKCKFNNYPAQKMYLDDMCERIYALGEARDEMMKVKPAKPFDPKPTKAPKPAKEIKPYAPLTKATAKNCMRRTAQSLKAKGYGEHEVKYILRFQGEGIISDNGNGLPELARCAAEQYLDSMREQRGCTIEGSEDYAFYNDRVQALKVVVAYFDELEIQLEWVENPAGARIRTDKDWERENNRDQYYMEN